MIRNILKFGDNFKLADFGESKIIDSYSYNATKLIGTPNYMSPQVSTGDYDNRTDIWFSKI